MAKTDSTNTHQPISGEVDKIRNGGLPPVDDQSPHRPEHLTQATTSLYVELINDSEKALSDLLDNVDYDSMAPGHAHQIVTALNKACAVIKGESNLDAEANRQFEAEAIGEGVDDDAEINDGLDEIYNDANAIMEALDASDVTEKPKVPLSIIASALGAARELMEYAGELRVPEDPAIRAAMGLDDNDEETAGNGADTEAAPKPRRLDTPLGRVEQATAELESLSYVVRMGISDLEREKSEHAWIFVVDREIDRIMADLDKVSSAMVEGKPTVD